MVVVVVVQRIEWTVEEEEETVWEEMEEGRQWGW
ncbi:hypothetical protein E2C01_051900 [Portunus trituberculatus]|uniref:Uncharacterized protein n=1 Tax=Portunus trituberculatus TaxID=210409 RepID=A0A5B7GK11_PORTR|nr:hypothetical protein [Portunus trituberculatus]